MQRPNANLLVLSYCYNALVFVTQYASKEKELRNFRQCSTLIRCLLTFFLNKYNFNDFIKMLLTHFLLATAKKFLENKGISSFTFNDIEINNMLKQLRMKPVERTY